MTKGRAALPCTAAKQTLGREEGGVFASAYLATTIYGSVTLPFVIPSAAEGSAVRPGSRTKVWVLLVLTHTLKPSSLRSSTARLKPCPDTKHEFFCSVQSGVLHNIELPRSL